MTGQAGTVRGATAGTRAWLARLAGAPTATRRVRLLVVTVLTAAPILILLGVVLHATLPTAPTSPYRIAVAVALVAAGQVAAVRVRIGSGSVALGWGEAALVVVLYWVPPGWVPLSIFLGSGLAQLLMQVTTQRRPLWIMAFNACQLTIAGAGAALLAYLIAEPFNTPLSPLPAVALAAGSVLNASISLMLVASVASQRSGARFIDVASRTVTPKLFMIVGNVTVGLIIVAMIGAGLRWLIVLPPVLWLLRQSYAFRLRADEERRGWRIFSSAARALNRLDERSVAEAGVHGAVRLFAADTAEVLVLRNDGSVCGYRGGRTGAVAAVPMDAIEDSADSAVTGRPLLVGGVAVGELRVRFIRPIQLTPREQMQLSAFGDALAAALHDAAAHDQLQTLSERSSHDARHDTVTGIANRATLLAVGNSTLKALDRETQIALLLLDINHFKEVNDTLGHAAGDELLKIIAQRVTAASHSGDLVARLGGDEFGVLVTSLGPSADGTQPGVVGEAIRRARDLADLLASPTEVSGLQLAVEVSVGVVVASAASCDMTELLRRADIAMYQAKRGGGAVAWYDSATDLASTDRLTLLAELREALQSPQQLVLALQPIVDLRTGTPIGLEALIRWQHPRRGELRPTEFGDVLENSELVAPFTRYVLDRALAVTAQLATEDIIMPISVNLSPRSLLGRNLPDEIGELLARHGVPAERLVLEITETVVVPEHAMVTEVLTGLRALGVQLAVADFGTGYSSLTFLTRIHVDEVKVDRSFVSRMVDSPEAMAIVRTTVDLAHELNLRVVAEGVETAAQKAALVRMGCTAAQGHHFFAPMSPEKIGAALREALRPRAGGRVIPLRAEDAS